MEDSNQQQHIDNDCDNEDEEEQSPKEMHAQKRNHTLQTDESCQGPLGVALRRALESMGVDNNTTNDGFSFTPEQVDRIVGSFGSAIATTCQEMTPHNNDPPAAPSATLKGRLDYANQYGDKWRIVVEDAVIETKRRGKHHRGVQDEGRDLPLKIPRLEILAFNDSG